MKLKGYSGNTLKKMLRGLRERFLFLFRAAEADVFYDQLIEEGGFGVNDEFKSHMMGQRSASTDVTKGGESVTFRFPKKRDSQRVV